MIPFSPRTAPIAALALRLLLAEAAFAGTAVNCGGPEVTDGCGTVWAADHGFDGGHEVSTDSEINGSLDPEVFRTARAGVPDAPLAYSIPVSDGDYEVMLYFVEVSPGGPGSRRFDADVEGFPVAAALDIEAMVGPYALHAVRAPATVGDGAVDILLRPLDGAPLICAIEVLEVRGDCFRCPTVPVVEFDPEDTVASLSWLDLAPYDGIRIFRDGSLLEEVGGDREEHLDADASIGYHTYRIEARSAENVCSSERALALGCAGNLTCHAGKDGSIIARWDNPLIYDEIEVRLDGEFFETIPGSEFEYITAPLQPGEHLLELVMVLAGASCPPLSCRTRVGLFRRGDADGSGVEDITDAIVIVGFLFLGDSDPGCLDASDLDDSGLVDISDPIALLEYLYLGGDDPPPPGPLTCGPDGKDDDALPPCVYLTCR